MVIGNGSMLLVRPEYIPTLSNNLKLDLSAKELKEALSIQMDFDSQYTRYGGIDFERIDDKLIVKIYGMLVPRGDWFSRYLGYVGMDCLSNLLTDAEDDPSVGHVILRFDSPGSTAIGVWECASAVNKLRATKRVTTVCEGNLCSGAYMLGSFADEIYSTSRVNQVGSIGVVVMHTDRSVLDANLGLKVTYLAAGRYKAYGNEHEALTEEVKATLMESINLTYNEFKTTIQLNRNMAEEEVNAVVEGKIFAASQAEENGLIDGIKLYEDILTLGA